MSEHELQNNESVDTHAGEDHGTGQQESGGEEAGHDDHHHHAGAPDPEPYDEQALAAAVAAADWSDLTARLMLYASHRLFRFGFAKRSGNSPEDYAQTAITLVLEGTRRLRIDRENPSLFGPLCSVVDSLIIHDVERILRRVKSGAAEIPIVTAEGDDVAPNEITEERLGSPDNFETELIARDHFEHFACSLEPRLAEYVRLRVTGRYATAEEYANALATTVQEIRNLDRQLWRRRNLYDLREPGHPVRGKTRSTLPRLLIGAA